MLVYAGNEGCLTARLESNSTQPCLCNDSFEGIVNESNGCSAVTVTFSLDSVALKENINVSKIEEFRIEGVNTTVQCSQNCGLTLSDIHTVTIIGMNFVGCGIVGRRFIGNLVPVNFQYALFVSRCSNVSLLHTRIADSRGTGLVLLNNHMVSVAYSEFTENNPSMTSYINHTPHGDGGGIYFELSCSQEPHAAFDKACYCSDSTFIIEQCNFTGNRAASSPNIHGSGVTGLGNGGGLEVWINDSSHNHLHVNNSKFLNNSAAWGGAVQIVFSTESHSNTVTLEQSLVDSNSVSDKGGGGLDLGCIGENVTNNHVLFSHVNFTRNTALFGGAMSVFTSNASKQKNNSICWKNCNWSNNSAHYAAAINVAPQRVFLGNEELILSLINCSFESNWVFQKFVKKHIRRNGKGIIMITGGAMKFISKVLFVNNNSSCIYAISSTLLFSSGSNVIFLNNSANIGGGISLIGFSVILVGENTSLTFCNNSVARYGSAIYYFSIDKSAYVYPRSCFIQKFKPDQTTDNVFFNFFGNTAQTHTAYKSSGRRLDAIYGTSLKACSEDKEYGFYSVGKFSYCKTCEGSRENIESEDYAGCMTPDMTEFRTIEGNISVNLEEDVFKFVPGKKFHIPVSMHVAGKIAHALYFVMISNHKNSNITIPESYFVSKGKLTLRGSPGDRATVTFTEIYFRKLSISIEVEALDCPPLYKMKESVCVCISTKDIHFVEFHECTEENYQASVRLGYWIKYANLTNQERGDSDRYALLNSYCPLGYCSNNESEEEYHKLPEHFTELDDVICNSRQDTLCGLCTSNTTVYFHSKHFKCGSTDRCYLGPLFYLLSEILPLTLLFVFIIVFNISFTSGYLNGFIFFAQMYDIIAEIGGSFIPHVYNQFSSFHRLFFKLFNIDFFNIEMLSFCLFKTQKTLNILLVKYFTVAYGFFLVLGTVWLIQCCSKFNCLRMRSSRYSIIQGLSAFLVMVYSQCTFVSFSILNLIYIYNGTDRYKLVVFLQGNIEYFRVEHLPYAIPALLCLLLFVAPLPVLLIVYPLCNRFITILNLENNRVIKLSSRLLPVTKIKPLLDCFQGAFKDNFRFFAGFYFVYRVTILSSRFTTGVFLIHTIIEIQLIFMLAVHALAWPYQKRIHNIIDLFVFANLAIINGLKLLQFFYTENISQSKTDILKIDVIQGFFIYIPIIILCLVIFFKLARKLKAWLLVKVCRTSNKLSDRVEERRVSCEDSDDDFLENNRRSIFASESYRMVIQKRKKSEELIDVIG